MEFMSSTIELVPALSGVVGNTVVDVEAETERDTFLREDTATDVPWVVLVWNDPVNLMTYVTFVLQELFGYDEPTATTLMLQVHQEGKSVVATGTREKAERDTQAMHSFGLWATFQKANQA